MAAMMAQPGAKLAPDPPALQCRSDKGRMPEQRQLPSCSPTLRLRL